MDSAGYEYFSFNNSRAINISEGTDERTFPAHRHAYGEIILVGKGNNNIYRIDDKLYSLTEGDIILVWPMEMHEIVDADRSNAVVIQYSNTLADSLFDFKRIVTLYHDLHILCVKTHAGLLKKLTSIIDKMLDEWHSDKGNREMRCAMVLTTTAARGSPTRRSPTSYPSRITSRTTLRQMTCRSLQWLNAQASTRITSREFSRKS